MFLSFAMIALLTACATAPTLVPPNVTTAAVAVLTSTPIPPTATRAPVPQIATPTSAGPVPTLAKDERGFSILETENATILAQSGVSDARAREVAQSFKVAYQVVGEDLGYAERRPRLYVYRSEDELFQDLVTTWKYPEWYITSRAFPRMSRDYVTWIPPLPKGDAQFIAHEYSHRIIEQIAGVASQVNYKWFDEGLAEYEGIRALARESSPNAQAKQQQQIGTVANAYKAGKLIRFRDMTTEEQLVRLIQSGAGDLAYPQASIAMKFLISQRGIAQVKNVLSQIGQGNAFANAFQKIYGFTVDDFEKEFLAYVAKSPEKPETATCFAIDGQANDWQKLKPVIVDDAYPPIARAADVRQVYAATCQGALYLLIVPDGPADAGGDVQYCFQVDLTDDDNPEYQPGFDRTHAWVWNLKGTGYADMKSNMRPLTDKEYKAAFGAAVEFMLPLSFLENATAPRIRVYTFVGSQMANRFTTWANAQPLE